MELFRRAAFSLVSSVWLVACAERPDGNLLAASTQRPLADAGQPSSTAIDAHPDAGVAANVGFPFLGRYLLNARDLGGIHVRGAARVASGRLFRGPAVPSLPGNGCDAFAGAGVRSVIDLRTPSETTSQPDVTCISDRAQIVFAPLPLPSSASPEEYIAMLDARDSIFTFFTVLADSSAYPIYFHCSWGRDRAGVAAALVLLALGAARQDIMEDYLRSRQTGGVTPEPLDAALDEIERRGGIEAYLSTMGVSAQMLDALQHAVVEPLL